MGTDTLTTPKGTDRLTVKGELYGWRGTVYLVQDTVTQQHYAVSGVDPSTVYDPGDRAILRVAEAFGNLAATGWEVLVFACDATGHVSDWGEVAGGKGVTHQEAIEQLSASLSAEPVQ